MTIDVWLFYITTVLVLMSTPGPSQLLMLSNSMSHGFKRATATALGDLTANAIQMLAAGLGLAALLAASGNALVIIKWAGVSYLIWLGIKMISKAKTNRLLKATSDIKPSLKSLFLQGFITSAANPKAIVFFAALFPQFIQSDQLFWPQLGVLAITYILMDGLFLSIYGGSASWMVSKFKGKVKVWMERAAGSFMILAAILLSLTALAK